MRNLSASCSAVEVAVALVLEAADRNHDVDGGIAQNAAQ